MKLIFFVLFYFLAVARAANTIENVDKESTQKISFPPTAEEIQAIIDMLKEVLRSQFDPFIFKNKSVSIHDPKMDLDVDLSGSGKVVGLLDFNSTVKIALIFAKYTLDFPEIDLDIEPYHLLGSIGALQIFGDGPIKVKIQNLTLDGKLYFTPSTSVIKIGKLITTVTLEDFKFKLEGWLHDEGRSKLISEQVEKNVPKLIKKYEKEITIEITKLWKKYVEGTVIPLP